MPLTNGAPPTGPIPVRPPHHQSALLSAPSAPTRLTPDPSAPTCPHHLPPPRRPASPAAPPCRRALTASPLRTGPPHRWPPPCRRTLTAGPLLARGSGSQRTDPPMILFCSIVNVIAGQKRGSGGLLSAIIFLFSDDLLFATKILHS